MRRIVVALLGIQITIIALASAASAATHPEGSAVHGSTYEARPGGWMNDPMAAVLSDTYEVGPLSDAWAFERFVIARARLEAIRDWEASRSHWAHAEHPSVDHIAHIAADEFRVDPSRAKKAKSRSGATKAVQRPMRMGVAKMPRLRSHAPQRRAQVDLTRVLPRTGAMHMSHSIASGWLKSAGLRTKSTGNCTSKHIHHCTSLDRVRTGTIAKVIQLKRQSGCPIMVTGGTERGHAPGHFSHGNGYKLDISHNACIDRHITKNHDKAGVRGDGATIYKSDSGTTFFDESDHWDILFR